MRDIVTVQTATDDAAAKQVIERLRNLDMQAIADSPPMTRWFYTCSWPNCFQPESGSMPNIEHVSRLAQEHRIGHLLDLSKEIEKGTR